MLTRLGPYEVRGQIAEGGMAVVYLGRRHDPTPGEFALKVIHPRLARDQGFIGMFLDEARLTARLSHPNIVKVYEQQNDGRNLFIAMELLLGQTLTRVWEATSHRDTPLGYEVIAWIGARVADGLRHAHELVDEEGVHLEVVHRDINPSNVFITYRGQVKIIDFGLAKALDRVTTTEVGIVKGKLAYMSPEQLFGNPVDHRADLFSLGTTLWEMTCGRRLFKGETDLETTRKVQAAIVPHPAVLLPGYPPALASILLRALAKDPDVRYQTAEELGRDLDAFVEASGKVVTPAVLLAIMRDLFPGECDRDATWYEQAAEQTHTEPLSPLMLRPPVRPAAPGRPASVPPPSSLPQPVAVSIAPPAPPPRLAGRPSPPGLLGLLTGAELAMFAALGALVLVALTVAALSLAR
jgi:serine/threonine-protein kinase